MAERNEETEAVSDPAPAPEAAGAEALAGAEGTAAAPENPTDAADAADAADGGGPEAPEPPEEPASRPCRRRRRPPHANDDEAHLYRTPRPMTGRLSARPKSARARTASSFPATKKKHAKVDGEGDDEETKRSPSQYGELAGCDWERWHRHQGYS